MKAQFKNTYNKPNHIEKLKTGIRNRFFELKDQKDRLDMLKGVYDNTMIDRGSVLDALLVELTMKLGLEGYKPADDFFYFMTSNMSEIEEFFLT